MNSQQADQKQITSWSDFVTHTTSGRPSPQPTRRLVKFGRMVVDVGLLNLAFGLAYFARYNLQIGAEVSEAYQVPLSAYWWSQLGFVAIFFVLLQFKGFYRQRRSTSLIDELGIIASATAYAVLTVLAAIFILRPESVSRLMYLMLFPLALGLLSTERIVARQIRRSLRERGIGVRKTLVLGATEPAWRVMQAIVETPRLGLRLSGYVDDEIRFPEWALPLRYRSGEPVPYLGRIEDLPRIAREQPVEELIVALPASMHQQINGIINLCHEYDINFMLVPDFFELQVNALDFQELNGVPLIGLRDNRLTGWNYLVKRVVDITLALLLMVLAIGPMALLALAIKLDSPGPIILRQTRVGKNGREFTFYKFRSMYVDADQRLDELQKYNLTGGATFKMTEDPRRTRVGRIIRRASLDELPQVFNILAGHMSFVGPRPGMPRELEQYRDWHFRRYEVTPGLTGLSQVSGRANLKFDETVRLDIYYAENWSLWLDLKILLRTIPAVLKREGAY